MDNNDLIWQNAKHHLEMLTTNFKYLEANSRNAASSDQPIVGPPSQSEDSRALARPVSLAELKAWAKKRYEVERDRMPADYYNAGKMAAWKEMFQHLTSLDQGPVAEELVFDWRRDPRINATESQQSEA